MTVCKNLTHGEDYGLLSLKIASYLYIGIFRLLSFIILFIIFYYSKKYAQRTGNLGRARFFLILPIYMDFLRLLILYCFFVGVVNIVFRNFFLSPFTLSLQLGGFHFFYEGLWFFFTQFGAGRKAFLRSSSFGLLSGAVSFFAFFTAMHFMDDGDDDSANYILLAYNVMYVGMSLLPICIPTELLYRRPAMLPYSVMQVAYYALFIIAVVLVFFGVDAGYCVAATNYILLDGILKPVIIFYTLSVDSQVLNFSTSNLIALG